MTNITNKKIYVIEYNKRLGIGRAFTLQLKNIHRLQLWQWYNLKGTGREFYTRKDEVIKHAMKLKKAGVQFPKRNELERAL
jgi:hypothetical protein